MNHPPRANGADRFFGVSVADPFRLLEDATDPRTIAWVEEQNRRTRAYLDAYPGYDRVRSRLQALYTHPRQGPPERHGRWYAVTRNAGLQDQSVLYVQEQLGGDAIPLLDPNGLSADGTAALSLAAFSHDGSLLAYGISRAGSDRQQLRIRTVPTGDDLPETLEHCKFASIAWAPDGEGFFYNRFPAPGTVPAGAENTQERVYWHRAGSPQREDTLIYERPEAPVIGLRPVTTDDGAHLLIVVSAGTDPRNGLLVRPMDQGGPFATLIELGEARFEPVEAIDSTLFVHTDLDAPRGRIVAVDLRDPARERWREIIPQGEDAIDFVALAGGLLVVVYLHHAHHRVALHSLDGRYVRDLPLPALGSIGALNGTPMDDELFLSFTSFLYPTTSLRYFIPDHSLTTLFEPKIDFDPSAFETTQVFVPSTDGEQVPMYLTHRRDLLLDGRHPVLLYGYGGFGVNLTPGFAVAPLLWLEQGGIYAVANLRGGGEYGEEWHRAGMLARKQQVFDDAIACAEWLVARNYTGRSRLAISGGSNGGLLVAACMVQRPDLYGAVVCQVPVIDMLRYHRFTVGSYWIAEYGNAEGSEEEFRYLHAYSPLHNLQSGTAYPPTLITSADTDDRVVPAHAKKFAAALQEAASGSNPILLRLDTRAGHGHGKPLAKVLDEQADILAFLFRVLDLQGSE